MTTVCDAPSATPAVSPAVVDATKKTNGECATNEPDGTASEKGKAPGWTLGETFTSVMCEDASRRAKSHSTKFWRADFVVSCWVQFATKAVGLRLWDDTIDIEKSRDLRTQYLKSGKNVGESPSFRKAQDVRRIIVNQILPIYSRLMPPASGKQLDDVLAEVKAEYYQSWRVGKKRYEKKEIMPDAWTTQEWEIFRLLGAPGKDLAFLQVMDDDDNSQATSREGARSLNKINKKLKIDNAKNTSAVTDVAPPASIQEKTRAELTASIKAHTRMSELKLVLQYGNEQQKKAALETLLASALPTTPAPSPTTPAPSPSLLSALTTHAPDGTPILHLASPDPVETSNVDDGEAGVDEDDAPACS